MLDFHLAELYGVETRVLVQDVKRNLIHFPVRYMFQLTKEELQNWKSQIVISNRERMGIDAVTNCDRITPKQKKCRRYAVCIH